MRRNRPKRRKPQAKKRGITAELCMINDRDYVEQIREGEKERLLEKMREELKPRCCIECLAYGFRFKEDGTMEQWCTLSEEVKDFSGYNKRRPEGCVMDKKERKEMKNG